MVFRIWWKNYLNQRYDFFDLTQVLQKPFFIFVQNFIFNNLEKFYRYELKSIETKTPVRFQVLGHQNISQKFRLLSKILKKKI